MITTSTGLPVEATPSSPNPKKAIGLM